MSYQATAWASSQKCGGAAGKLLLYALANYANADGLAYPTQKKLAADTELSVRSIRTWLCKLEEMGLIAREKGRLPSGQYSTDMYRLQLHQPAAKTAGGPAATDDTHQRQLTTPPAATGAGPYNKDEQSTEQSLGTNTPLTPQDGGDAAAPNDDWNLLCEGWKLVGSDSFERARRAFQNLDPEEKGLARRHAQAFQKDRPKAFLVTYVNQKRWQSYEQAGGETDKPKCVFVVRDSPEWDEWRKFRGRDIPIAVQRETGREGWYFETRRPPKERANAS